MEERKRSSNIHALGHFSQWRKNITRLHGVVSELIGFKIVPLHIHTNAVQIHGREFTAFFSFATSQDSENSPAIFKMTKCVK